MKTIKKSYKGILILLVIVAFLAGIFASFLAFYAVSSRESTIVGRWIEKRFYGEETAMIDAIKNVKPSVVSINVTSDVVSFGGKGGIVGGTGFVVDKNGLVMTNKHVVKSADKSAIYDVTFADGAKYQAVLVDMDPFDDIAFLKIVAGEKNDFVAVEFEDPAKIEVGTKVLTIGNSLGKYGHSATGGMISALDRNISAGNYGSLSVDENLLGLLQVDGPINLGNSGGPLFNLDGKIVGMVVALEDSAYGIGFAIPSNDLLYDLKSILENGKIVRTVLGVRFVMLNEEDAKAIDPVLNYGALVIGDKGMMQDAVLKNSNVYKAGIRERDVILGVDDTKIDMNNFLNDVIRNYSPGDKVKIKFWREGRERTVEVILNGSKDFEQK
ncbi:MAG: trypsin-like peptidase domain-containing protein [Candidatus Gracilibacteria bacterium]|jgi:serine protease Do